MQKLNLPSSASYWPFHSNFNLAEEISVSKKNRVYVTDESSGKELDLPVIAGTEGEPTLEIKTLPSTLGYFTYDPGFTATASCTSNITFIDGGKGILRYRGYPIEQLAEKSTFLEVAYLLLNGDLPREDELQKFRGEITYHTMVHEQLNHFISGFQYDAHPMAMMAGVVGSLAAFYHNRLDMENPEHRMVAATANDCKNANHCCGLLPAPHGLALRLSPKLTEILRAFPAHDVLGTERGIPGQ